MLEAKERTKEMIPTPPVSPNEEQDSEDKSMHYVPWGVESFAELDEAEKAIVSADAVTQLVSNFQEIVWNIMYSSGDVEKDKPAAIRQLSGEFVDRLEIVTRQDIEKQMLSNDPKPSGMVAKIKKVFKREDSKSKNESDLFIWKDKDGANRWIARYSNKFRDDDNPPEIISSKSHEKFVKLVDEGFAPLPALWIWHERKLKLGAAEWVAYDDAGFALAGGVFDPEHDALVEVIKSLDGVKLSHGMPIWSIERDEKDNTIITQHITEEISLLPGWAAANKRTDFVILEDQDDLKERQDMISEEKRARLAAWGVSPEMTAKLEQLNEREATKAVEDGIESKEAGDTQAEDVVQAEQEPTVEPVEEVVEDEAGADVPAKPEASEELIEVLGDVVGAIVGFKSRLDEMEQSVKQLREEDEVKIAQKAILTPLASLQETLRKTVVGADETKVDGRTSLGKASPTETEPKPANGVGIPFIDQMISTNNAKAGR